MYVWSVLQFQTYVLRSLMSVLVVALFRCCSVLPQWGFAIIMCPDTSLLFSVGVECGVPSSERASCKSAQSMGDSRLRCYMRQYITSPPVFDRRTVQPVASRYTDYVTWPSVFLRMRNISGTRRTEDQNTHFVLSNFFFFRKSFCL